MGRLIKWAIELNRHEISYESKTAIKGQQPTSSLNAMVSKTKVKKKTIRINNSLGNFMLTEPQMSNERVSAISW